MNDLIRLGRSAFYICLTTVALACAPVSERIQSSERAQVSASDTVRTDDEIQAVFDQNKSKLYSIYQRALRNDPTIKGMIVLSITIEPSGQVSECKVHQTNIKDPALLNAVCGPVLSFNFGPKNMTPITLTYPITFLPA